MKILIGTIIWDIRFQQNVHFGTCIYCILIIYLVLVDTNNIISRSDIIEFMTFIHVLYVKLLQSLINFTEYNDFPLASTLRLTYQQRHLLSRIHATTHFAIFDTSTLLQESKMHSNSCIYQTQFKKRICIYISSVASVQTRQNLNTIQIN